jgi:hypothetical protein
LDRREIWERKGEMRVLEGGRLGKGELEREKQLVRGQDEPIRKNA